MRRAYLTDIRKIILMVSMNIPTIQMITEVVNLHFGVQKLVRGDIENSFIR